MQNVLYLQIDEDLSSALQRIEHFKDTLLHLVVPKKSILFQSSVNLGILKHRCEERGNTLILITEDRIGLNLAKNVQLKGQNKLLSGQAKNQELKKEEAAPHPIQARRNEVHLDSPRRTEKKFTLGQLIQELREKKGEASQENAWQRFRETLYYSRPVMLGIIFTLSLGVFFLISYIALPAATLSIRPAFEPLSHSANVIFADRNRQQNLLAQGQANIIPVQIIESTAKETRVFNTTGQRFDGTNAEGQLTIINAAREEWPLIERTRFMSSEGIVFRSQEGVIVPAATPKAGGGSLPGRLTIEVVADEFDRYRQPVGERGNLEPTQFILPALSAYNQKRIWAESTAPMTGGTTAYSTLVLEADIEAAKNQLEENLGLIAKSELQSRLEEMNQKNQTHLVLLDDPQYISTTLQEVRVPENLEGSEKEKFEVYAQVLVKGVAYDSESLFHFLQKEMEKRAHPDMQVRPDSIDPDQIQYDFVDKTAQLDHLQETGQVKLTVTVSGIQEYVIDSSAEAGLRFSQKVKEKIINLPVEKARLYLENLPEVEEVDIQMWPIWLKKIPRLSEKIEVELLE